MVRDRNKAMVWGKRGRKHRLGEEQIPLHGRVRAALYDAILSRRLEPGQRLIETRLAEELGVSRNPVREAIRALASEGLVRVTARRGVFVATFSEQEARDTIEVRAVLEGQNARLAARRLDAPTRKRIEGVLARGNAARAAGRIQALATLNAQFHEVLAVAGHNEVLGEILRRLRERTVMLFRSTDPARQALLWDEHRAILGAILAGEETEAAALYSEHVLQAGADFLAQQPPTASLSARPAAESRGRAATPETTGGYGAVHPPPPASLQEPAAAPEPIGSEIASPSA